MSDPLLPFDRWPSGISQASIPANNNARRSDILAYPALSATTAAQPASPTDGDVYIIPAAATGTQWATFDEDDVAIYYGGTWTAFAPPNGLTMFVVDEDANWQFNTLTGWAVESGGGSVTAADVSYDNSTSGLTATDVQAAIDELAVAPPGSGDVVGPASSVDDRIVTFDGVTGKLIQDGGNTIAGLRSPAIQSIVSSATVTPTFLDDMVKITAQAAGLTLANPTGTAIPGLGIVIRIKDNGTARSIAYGTQYRAVGVTLPTTTVINKTLYLAMIFNSDDTKWDVLAVGQEA